LNASYIRLHITPSNKRGTRGRITNFLSLSFPKLSKLDIENFPPNSSSPIFTTSNLTSLKLCFPYDAEPYYTLVQLSQILQKHPDLRELDLESGAAPLGDSSEAPVSFVLPRLVDFRLHGTEAVVTGLVDLVGMSSPLRNVVIRFPYHNRQTIPALVSAAREIVVAYYGCQGLDYPRKAGRLTISSDWLTSALVFNAEPHSTSASYPTSKLKLHFNRTDDGLAEDTALLFPLRHVRKFTAVGLNLPTNRWRRILQKMEGLSHLWLDCLDIGPVLGALTFDDQGVYKEATETALKDLHAHR
jgi:hypothetical protein